MKPIYICLIAFAVSLGAFWGGAYALELVSAWARFPTIMTTSIAAVTGLWVGLYFLMEHVKS